MGMVSLLLETLVDFDESMSKRFLGVLDGLFTVEEGREKAYENALVVPVLVKKVLRGSDLATEFAENALVVPVLVKKVLRGSDLATKFAVSMLWKMGKKEEKREFGGHFSH
ncbi:hypothetical protein U1Q18_033045 [Sarracenia purpurea var. burkii]